MEGVSMYDTGNWSLVIQPPNHKSAQPKSQIPNPSLIRTEFWVIVRPRLATNTELPIKVKVGYLY